MLPRILYLKFLNMLFWLGPIGFASGAGSMTLQTSFWGKGPHLKQWLVMLLSAPDSFLRFSGVFLSHKANAGNLLHCPRCPPPPIPLSPSSSSRQRLTDKTDLTRGKLPTRQETCAFGLNRSGAATTTRCHRLYRADNRILSLSLASVNCILLFSPGDQVSGLRLHHELVLGLWILFIDYCFG